MGNDFNILDSAGNPMFFVDGQAFSWGNKLSFQDMSGRELAFIDQKMMSFMPKYQIHRDGKIFAEVIKEFSWFSKEFTLDVPGPNDYSIKGRFWKHDYQFVRNGRIVASINKAPWAWSDCYGVEIEAGEDDISILSTVIVIDQILHDSDD